MKLWNKLINKKDEESQKIIGLKYNSRENMLLEDVIEKKEMSLTINGTEYKVLGLLKYSIDYSHWEEYKRTKKSILDTISIICSLSLTIFNDEDTDKLDEENNQENNDN